MNKISFHTLWKFLEPPALTLLLKERGRICFSVFLNDLDGNLPKIVPNSRGVIKRPLSKTLGSVLKCSDMSFLDFLNKCLQWDAKERMTPQEALEHPFICGQRYIPTLNQLKIPKTFRHSVASNSAIEMSDVIVPRVFGNTIQYQKPPLRQQYSNPVLTEIDALPQISPRQLPLTPKRMSKLDQSTPNRKWR
jgi:serine/threonine protein kinase